MDDASNNNLQSIIDKTEDDYKVLRSILPETMTKDAMNENGKIIGCFWGFEILIPDIQIGKNQELVISKNGAQYRLEIGKSGTGNARRVINFLTDLPGYIDDSNEKLMKKETALVQLKEESEQGNPYIDRVHELENDIRNLKAEMDIDDFS